MNADQPGQALERTQRAELDYLDGAHAGPVGTVLLVRYRPGTVGLTRRVVHVVPPPAETVPPRIPDVLSAL
jgi:hypothetical protein